MSEGAFSREGDKERLVRLRRALEKAGYAAPPPSPAVEYQTVDVLAEISANHLRIRLDARESARYAPPERRRTVVDGPKKGVRPSAPPPGQSAVLADSLWQYYGRNWFNAAVESIQPRLAASALPPARPLSRAKQLQLEAQTHAAAAASTSLVFGSLLCAMGFIVAGTVMWRRLGRPDRDGLVDHLQGASAERLSGIRAGPLGQSTVAIGERAESAIKGSSTLRDFAAGLRRHIRKEG